MSTAHRFVLAAGSPLRNAWAHVLNILRVPADQISSAEQPISQVVPTEGQPASGALPMLSVLRASAQDEELRAFLGANDAACRALVNQWATLASKIAILPSAADEAEVQLGETPNATHTYLASSPRATVADVLLYASLTAELEARLPRLAQWASFVAADAYIAPIARARTTSGECGAASSTVEEGTQAKGQSAAAGIAKPSVEEIERRRVEKEKARAEKERLKEQQQQQAGTSGNEQAASPPAAAAAPKAQNPNQKGSNASKVDSVDIDIRVGRIDSIAKHPEADKLFVETISLGPKEASRTIVSGLVGHYTAEELLGAHVLVVCNLKPKPLKGIPSHGMVLCASNEDGLRIVSPPDGTLAGERVQFGGKLSTTPPPVPSNAATVELLGHFKTTSEGIVCWKDQLATVASGHVKSSLVNAIVK